MSHYNNYLKTSNTLTSDAFQYLKGDELDFETVRMYAIKLCHRTADFYESEQSLQSENAALKAEVERKDEALLECIALCEEEPTLTHTNAYLSAKAALAPRAPETEEEVTLLMNQMIDAGISLGTSKAAAEKIVAAALAPKESK